MLRYRARSEGVVSDGAFTPGGGDGPGGQPESVVTGKLEIGQVSAWRSANSSSSFYSPVASLGRAVCVLTVAVAVFVGADCD